VGTYTVYVIPLAWTEIKALPGNVRQRMKECQFTIIIEQQPEGEYLVSVPTLPDHYSEGSTLEEAREMAADANGAD
jgi:hypothetical protein